ncbi:uncharacterized protein LOC119073795 [Bradysia coprophila]|uniref:uncharacterized protein LOC119073795 n=1 Tax=Bradysia coprophila TaxID=38358 RepID=UPI00187DD9AC|nr:uncharacterized protein LOC119073795 [Bradysia coprophila]
MNTVVETDVNDIFKEEIVSVKTIDHCQSTDILQRIWAKALNHVYKKDTASFETVAQFVLQHTESMLFGFNWNSVPHHDVQQIEEHITQWLPSLTSPILRDKCQHILDHIHSPHSHPILNKLKRENITKDWLHDAIQYLMMETGSTIVQRLKVYSSFPDYAMIIQYAKNCWGIISSLSLDHPLSKAISVDEFYSILAYHLTSMYTTGDLNYIFQVIIDMEITETLKLIEKFPVICGEMEGNGEIVIDLLYKYHFNEFLRSTDNNTSVDEHLMILTNSYCQRYKHKSPNEFGNLILDIASTGLNCPTKKLFIVLHVIHNECTDSHLNFKLRLAYLGLTHDFNQLELKKADIDCDMYDIMAAEAELSEFFVFLGDVLIKFPEIHRECFLTAFTLNPSQQLYQKLKDIASSQGIDSSSDVPKGSIPAITNTGYLVTHNYNPFESPNFIMDTNEIDIDVREDLSRAITHPRLKFISWGMPYDEFCDLCEKLMAGQKEEFTKNVVALANESLEYVDIDFTRFKDLPEREVDDGIEKGYHMFLDDEDSSEEDDDKTMTSPEAAELIKEDEIRLKKKKTVLKRKSTICKKLMENGVPMKKILMKAPPRKIPRPPQCNRIDWKHIEELKEYFKEHSQLIKATQMFNDAQTLIDKLTEMSANKEPQLPEQSSTNAAMGAMSGDVNLNIIPIDPNTGVVLNHSSSTEHENFPNTSLVLPNAISHITDTSNIAAVNLPTPSTSMTLPNPNDPVAEITKQILQLLDDVDAELRLHYRRQKNYLAGIKRKMIKTGGIDKTNADSKPNQISATTDENASMDVLPASNSSNIPIEQNVNPVDVKVEDMRRETYDVFTSNQFESTSSMSAPLMNFTQFTDPSSYGLGPPQGFIEDNKDFVNAFLEPIHNSYTPSSTMYDTTPQSLPAPEQSTNHYDEIINMVATSYVDDGDSPVDKRKATKKRKKLSVPQQCSNESPIQQMSIMNNIGASAPLIETYGNSEPNGYGHYNDSSTTITELDVRKDELGIGIFCAPNVPQVMPVDGVTTEIKIKKPRKPRGPNKRKKVKPDSDQSIAEGPDGIKIIQGQLGESGQNAQLATEVLEPKKVKPPRAPRPRVPKHTLPDGSTDSSHFTPNCKLSDLPDDVLSDKGKSYMDSIERAIQKVMAGVEYDIQPPKIINSDEMTMMEIDGVLENILNMNNGINNGVSVNRDDCKATVPNHSRNNSTIEQDYTENFDLDLTNDNLYQDGNEPVESSQPPVEEDKNKVTILSELLADEPQYFSADPSMGGDNCDSSNLMNTSTDTSGNYSTEFNGFAELILPPSIKAECQPECAFTPSENCTSYTDISYNTKPSSTLGTEMNEAFVKHDTEIEVNDVFVKPKTEIDRSNGQSTSNQFVKSTVERLPQHFPNAEPQKVDLNIRPDYTNFAQEPVGFQQQSDYQTCNIMENVSSHPAIPTNSPIISPPPVQKVNGTTASTKSDRLTSSLRLIRKPNFRQSMSSTTAIKTRKLSIRLDRSVVDDFLATQRKNAVRLLQPIVVLRRLEDEDGESTVKRSKTSRMGKRKQNRAIWDGETVKDKKTFKRRRDDMDDAEGSSGFTGGSGGSCYSSDSQSGSSGTRDSVDSPPPKSTNGASDSIEHCKEVSCSVKMVASDSWNNLLAKHEINFSTPCSGKDEGTYFN